MSSTNRESANFGGSDPTTITPPDHEGNVEGQELPPGGQTWSQQMAAFQSDGGNIPTGHGGNLVLDARSCGCCRKPLLEPVSLLCGHSFCRLCLDSKCNWTQLPCHCPTCRGPIEQKPSVNAALSAWRDKLAAGYEPLVPVEDAQWTTLFPATNRFGAISTRRSIVEKTNRPKQLALALKKNVPATKVKCIGWTAGSWEFNVSLCLLELREDHNVAEDLFPKNGKTNVGKFIANGQRGEIVVTGATVDLSTGVAEKVQSVQRADLSKGGVMFHIDPIAIGGKLSATQWCFRHDRTGTELHLRIPKCGETIPAHSIPDDGIFADSDCDACGQPDGITFLDCDGRCGRQICLACVNRHEVPDGDWICTECAPLFDIHGVGVEGHEYPLEREMDRSSDSSVTDSSETDRHEKRRKV